MLNECECQIGSDGKELVTHGAAGYPVAVYRDDLNHYAVEWHWHDEWEFIFSVQGLVTVAAGTSKYTLKPGEGIFVNSTVLHGAWPAGTESKIHSFVFHPRLLGGIDSVYWTNYIYPFMKNQNAEHLLLTEEIPWHKEMLEKLDTAWGIQVRDEKMYEWSVRSYLTEVFFLLFNNIKSDEVPINEGLQKNDRRIKKMLSYIQEHFGEDISAEDIAAAGNVSVSEALRCFKKIIGVPPIKYLLQYRIDKAAIMLSQTDMKASRIGEECGFTDMSYFTKRFRENKGYSPLEYRKVSRQA